jgi:hypothetical protein
VKETCKIEKMGYSEWKLTEMKENALSTAGNQTTSPKLPGIRQDSQINQRLLVNVNCTTTSKDNKGNSLCSSLLATVLVRTPQIGNPEGKTENTDIYSSLLGSFSCILF